ncbi:MAG: hypothetical protein H6581_02720 [Bacteroidia bacterium]|nr:hypothetical protein [Bacteroidia bacterium]
MSRNQVLKTPSKFLFSALFLLALLLSGCPVGSDFSLGEPGTEAIDKGLIGTWFNDNPDAEVNKVAIARKDENSYQVEIREKGSLYSLEVMEFVGYVTALDGKSFVYFLDQIEGKYYLYEYSFSKDSGMLTTHDVGLLDKGVDGVTDTKTYREEVSSSLRKDNCLTSEIVWQKE